MSPPPTVTFTDVVLSEPVTIVPEYVTRSGKLFEAGVYEDKDFSMSPEELAAAVAAFQPCEVDLEHTPTILSGRLGRVESVSLSEDGKSLHGTVSLPKWLDDAIGTTERKVSATWNRATKHLDGLALVLSPRVADAALMAAFAAHNTPTGQMAVQRIHNVAAEHGAVCSKGNANMASRHEATAVQAAHDLMVEHGATCASLSPGSAFPSSFGANSPAAVSLTPAPKEGRSMSWKDRLIAAMSGMPDDEGDPPPPAPAPVVAAAVVAMSAADAEFKAMRQRADAAEAETRRLRSERISEKAVMFADKQLTDGRAFPAEREAIIAAYEGAAIDDVTFGVVTFGDGQTTTRTARLEAAYAARPAHQLTAESLTPALMSVLQGHRETPDQSKDRKATPDELEKLLNMTSQGQALMAATRGTDHNGKTNGRA